ncbi:MAG: BglG family transcription antiterminator [Enterococcus canintestini]|uniref:BglG family transcription antiterminator n=1 Tax=Enterococcus canintestini TaxID=317010 RepID=UPI0039937D68
MVMNVQNEVTHSQRRIKILLRLLDGEHLSYQQLSEEYFVSRSSIANDISAIRKIFGKEQLKLSFDNSGTFFEGTEVQVQRILKRVTLENVAQAFKNQVLDKELFYEVNTRLKFAIESKQIEISDSYLENIVISITLLIQRSRAGFEIRSISHNQFGKIFLEFNQYPLIVELLQELENSNIYVFSQAELQYLTHLIVASGLKLFVKADIIPQKFRTQVQQLIKTISDGLQNDLTQDAILEENLTIHLYQLIIRLEAQSNVVNPLIEEIKSMYPTVYGVVWFGLNDFSKPYGISLTDDEIGFVAIHFQAAIERKRKLNKILFVCPNGIGSSLFVSAKIRRILPNIDSIETASSESLEHMDLTDVDFIVSTVDLFPQKRPVVRVSPMVTPRDMKRIMNQYIDIVIEKDVTERVNVDITIDIKDKISQNIYFENLRTKQAAIDFLFEKQNFISRDKQKVLKDAVWEREKLQSTYLDNGFALPHGNPKLVEQTNVSILILDKPIDWGLEKVDIIVLLLISQEDTKQVEAIMELVMRGIENKDWFISKMMEVRE